MALTPEQRELVEKLAGYARHSIECDYSRCAAFDPEIGHYEICMDLQGNLATRATTALVCTCGLLDTLKGLGLC